MTTMAGLRIGLVGPVPPPAGGMAMQTRQLAELLRAEDAQVTLVPTNPPYRPAWVARWRGIRALARLLPFVAGLWRAAGRSDVMHVMANSGWSWHLFAAPAVWVAWMRRVPVVVNYRGGEAESFLARSSALVRATMRRAAVLVVPSGFLKEIFERHRMPAAVVPNVVDLARFHPGEPDAAPQLIVARNLEPIYDNAAALRAFACVRAEHPPARLLVAGSGPEEAALRALAVELGIDGAVEFTGRLDRDELAARLRRCRVALNPSRADNMPNSVLESLASGVPVVSTDVGGVRHVVDDGRSALLVPAGDHRAMAAAVLRLLREPDLARRLRDEGLRRVADFTWGRAGPMWAALYRRTAAEGRRTHA